MEITQIGKALSSETRIKILDIVSENGHSSIETFEKYGEEYEDDKRRETIYRELENLVKAGLLSKEYDETDSQIVYRLKHQGLVINIDSVTVEPRDE
ncbi:helix-turn-helix domain-containing protein [Halorussus salinus]|uniref:hypothetical protein n=1 Tax=Halorussus salinus TaxID=1364935 RepID=UPI0010927037|nr:hypothetical protein [Halorussus salinus]